MIRTSSALLSIRDGDGLCFAGTIIVLPGIVFSFSDPLPGSSTNVFQLLQEGHLPNHFGAFISAVLAKKKPIGFCSWRKCKLENDAEEKVIHPAGRKKKVVFEAWKIDEKKVQEISGGE